MSDVSNETPYANLSPDEILTAIEASGYRCDGHLLALNSYENRVYQIGLEDGSKIIAKFYRPAAPDRCGDRGRAHVSRRTRCGRAAMRRAAAHANPVPHC